MLLEAYNIWFSYPDNTVALKGVNFRLNEGEIVAILGPNGSGKSILLHILAELIESQRGIVLLNGRPPQRTITSS